MTPVVPSTPTPTVEPPHWRLPGTLVLRLLLVAVLGVALSGGMAAWLITRASGQEAVRRVVSQQTDEVEMLARLLASKIEQSQKVLRTVAAGVTPAMLESPPALEWLLQQGLPAVQFFDLMLVARANGELSMHLRAGRLEKASELDPAERDVLRRTLVDGKPLVSELIGGRIGDARVMFTMPLHREDGSVMGVVAGGLRLQSQGLLPPSMTQPPREDSRLIVFTRDGTILSHSDPARILGRVRDEPGLAPVYARWQSQAQPVAGRGSTQVETEHIVSMAGMPLPQWFVARVSPSRAFLEPLHGAQRKAWWLAAASMALCMLLVAASMLWMAQPLAQLTVSARKMLARSRRATPGPRHDGRTATVGGDAQPITWPRADGEVGELVQVFEGLGALGHAQQQDSAALGGQFQAILDSASVGIIITRHGMLEVVGHQACVMLGYADGELQGRPARVLYGGDADHARQGERVQAEFAAHGSFDGDMCFMRKDGTPVWARVQGRSVRPQESEGGTVWILEDITAAREAQVQQTWENAHDPLTQLYNREAFGERLGRLLAERSTRPRERGVDSQDLPGDGVVLFLDLDHFTVVNDIAGHDAGDDVLRHVARLLESQVRQMGWVARLGGDEFAVVLPGCALARGRAVAEQLRIAVRAWEPSYQGRSFTLGVSIGLVVLDASLHNVPSVLYAADMACYDAKRAGRNCVETRVARDAATPGRLAMGSA